MLTRQDDENLYLAFSDNPHYWSDPLLLQAPQQPWEFVKLGNCGSPIETEAGWLVLIHGVGPMRKYCIGATLLDLHDPATIIGQLKEPLLRPQGNEREGYVPNVVYSCGSLVHNGQLILPYGISDTASSIVTSRLTRAFGCSYLKLRAVWQRRYRRQRSLDGAGWQIIGSLGAVSIEKDEQCRYE